MCAAVNVYFLIFNNYKILGNSSNDNAIASIHQGTCSHRTALLSLPGLCLAELLPHFLLAHMSRGFGIRCARMESYSTHDSVSTAEGRKAWFHAYRLSA